MRRALFAALAFVAPFVAPSGAHAGFGADLAAQVGPLYNPSADAVDGILSGVTLDAGYDFGWIRPELGLFVGYHFEFLSLHVALRPGLRLYPFHRSLPLARGVYVRAAFDLEGVWRTEHGVFYGIVGGVGWEVRLWAHAYLLVEGEVQYLAGPVIDQLVPSIRLGGGVRF